MSLRAVHLALDADARAQAATTAAQARATFLATQAAFNKEGKPVLESYIKSLSRYATRAAPPKPKRLSAQELIQLFSALGIPEAKN
jgi:hypothetical protein